MTTEPSAVTPILYHAFDPGGLHHPPARDSGWTPGGDFL